MTTAETGASTGTDLRVIDVPTRRVESWRRYDGLGLVLAAALVCISLTPSLLPRSTAFQGWLSGIVAAAGYGLGALVSVPCARSWARIGGRRLPERVRRYGSWLLGIAGPVSIGGFLIAGRGWQRDAHRLVGQDPPGPLGPVLVVGLSAGCSWPWSPSAGRCGP